MEEFSVLTSALGLAGGEFGVGLPAIGAFSHAGRELHGVVAQLRVAMAALPAASAAASRSGVLFCLSTHSSRKGFRQPGEEPSLPVRVPHMKI
jgi:hypothetical protein